MLARVATVHIFQNRVAARLNRKMDIVADFVVIPDCFHDVFGEVFRVRRHKTNAEFPVDFRDFP